MKNPSSRLLVSWLAVSLAAAVFSRAQPAPAEPPVQFRTLALAAVVSDVFYDDARGNAVQVMASSGGVSPPYTCPPGGRVRLYRSEPPVPPETLPRRVALAETRLGPGGPWLVLMAAKTAGASRVERLELLALDASWTAHPAHTIRVFNFSKRKALVKIGNETGELVRGASRLFPYPGTDDQAWVKVAMEEDDGWVLRVSGPQATVPKTRSTLVLADAPPTPMDPDPRTVLIRNLLDTAPPPPAGAAQTD